MSKSKKGGKFEREICHILSLWWSDGKRDDLFWRTAGSGARAKVRGRKGRDTANQHGDICATDPLGQPLIDAFTFELKRGYSKFTIADLLDKTDKSAKQKYEEWFDQASESAKQAGSQSWAVIAQRNRRSTLIFIPNQAFVITDEKNHPVMLFHNNSLTVIGMKLNTFLSMYSPNVIKSIYRKK